MGYDMYGNVASVTNAQHSGGANVAPSAVKVGFFIKKSGATGTPTIMHYLGVEPKAIIIWSDGQDVEGNTGDYHVGFGFSDGTTSHSIATSSDDGLATSNASRRQSDALFTMVLPDENHSSTAELDSWNDTSFTIDWTKNDPWPYRLNYMIIGGADVSAKVINWNTPTSTGNFSVTGTGFVPDTVLHLYQGLGPATLPTQWSAAVFSLGAMDGAGNQWASFYRVTDNASTSDTVRGLETDSAIYRNWSGTADTRATYYSMDSNGFTVNFSVVPSTARLMGSLALEGLDIDVGSFTKSTGSAPASQAVTGVSFQPEALFLTGVQSTATSFADHARHGLGMTDGVAEFATAGQDADNETTTIVDREMSLDKVYVKIDNKTQTIDAEAELTSFDAGGFTLSWTTNDAVATEIVYLAVGTDPGSFTPPASPPETTLTYDLGGRLLTTTNELSHVTTFTYDNQNNILTAKDNLNNTTTNTYDAKGNLLTVTDANANANVTTYVYDNSDRLINVTDAESGVTTYAYDANGNRTGVTNANREINGTAESGVNCGTPGTGNGVDNDSDGDIDDGCPSVLYTYDNLGLLATQTDALGKVWSFTYDDARRLSVRNDAKDKDITYTYNKRGEVTKDRL